MIRIKDFRWKALVAIANDRLYKYVEEQLDETAGRKFFIERRIVQNCWKNRNDLYYEDKNDILTVNDDFIATNDDDDEELLLCYKLVDNFEFCRRSCQADDLKSESIVLRWKNPYYQYVENTEGDDEEEIFIDSDDLSRFPEKYKIFQTERYMRNYISLEKISFFDDSRVQTLLYALDVETHDAEIFFALRTKEYLLYKPTIVQVYIKNIKNFIFSSPRDVEMLFVRFLEMCNRFRLSWTYDLITYMCIKNKINQNYIRPCFKWVFSVKENTILTNLTC